LGGARLGSKALPSGIPTVHLLPESVAVTGLRDAHDLQADRAVAPTRGPLGLKGPENKPVADAGLGQEAKSLDPRPADRPIPHQKGALARIHGDSDVDRFMDDLDF
jgi:hypothetical protein